LDLKKYTFDKETKRKKVRQEFNILDDIFVFSLVGRIAPIKNHKLAIDAAKIAIKESNKPIKFLFVGDGELRDELIQYTKINELNTSYKEAHGNEDIIFTSWRNDIDAIMAASDAILLTSNNEGTPVSLIEAQASEKPIIATRVGGVADIVKDNAILVEKNNVRALAEAMIKIIDGHFINIESLVKNKDFILNNYSIEILVDNIKNLYLELFNSKFGKIKIYNL
jgi:glycosyltransferase involved in cell wall biosynthesis